MLTYLPPASFLTNLLTGFKRIQQNNVVLRSIPRSVSYFKEYVICFQKFRSGKDQKRWIIASKGWCNYRRSFEVPGLILYQFLYFIQWFKGATSKRNLINAGFIFSEIFSLICLLICRIKASFYLSYEWRVCLTVFVNIVVGGLPSNGCINKFLTVIEVRAVLENYWKIVSRIFECNFWRKLLEAYVVTNRFSYKV